jgi:hypothetical protein
VEQPSIVDLPYDERRIIVVTDKVPAPARQSREAPWDIGVATLGRLGGTLGLSVAAGATAALLIADAVKAFRAHGETIYPITPESACGLRFPPGHARRNVVYVGHPVDAGSYIPAADFHRFLFQHKVAEALRLVRSLGAKTIEVRHVEGWDRQAAARLGLGLPQSAGAADVEMGVDASRTAKAGHQILTTMTLLPSREPQIPDDLVWTPHEPLWAEVAAARLEDGLDEFVIDVRSTDDFGVNASLKVLIGKTKLDAGGKFVEHQDTTWRLQGTFS